MTIKKYRVALTIMAAGIPAMFALAGPAGTSARQKAEPSASGLILPMPEVKSPGVIGRTFRDSTPPKRQWVKPAAGAPNVVVVLLDDVGFGAAGTFGGLIPTPALDRIQPRQGGAGGKGSLAGARMPALQPEGERALRKTVRWAERKFGDSGGHVGSRVSWPWKITKPPRILNGRYPFVKPFVKV
jgi:hypothetical protein